VLSPQNIDIIRKSVLFQNIPDDITNDLLSASTECKIPRGKTLFIQGDSAINLSVVLEGWVKLTRITPAGEEIVLTVYSTGESFGEAAALRGGQYPVTAEAVTDCRVLSVKASAILLALRTRPELAVAMLTCTYQHLHELVIQIEDMKALSGAQRLAGFLVALAPVSEGSCTFSLPYDKVLISARLGMKPESLSRAFARLRERGVMVSRNNIAIADIEQLHDYIEEEKAAGWQKIGS
jgi:CRP-like cAMP-binding protein